MEKVKIGGITYEVSEVQDLNLKEGVIGQVLYNSSKIEIDSGLSKQMKDQTLVHEILHGCFKEAGYDEQDEEVIDRVGKVLYQVLKDNDFGFLRDDDDLLTPENLRKLRDRRIVTVDGRVMYDFSGENLVAEEHVIKCLKGDIL